MTHRHVAWLGLGSNLAGSLDAPADQLASALEALRRQPELTVLAVSAFYRTVPVGGPPDQPMFCNAAAAVVTLQEPPSLLAALHDIEAEHHRRRTVRWGPRTLDLDILAFDDRQSDDPALTLPHPRAHERGFVLVPLAEIAPTLELGPAGRVVDCLAGLDVRDVTRWSKSS